MARRNTAAKQNEKPQNETVENVDDAERQREPNKKETEKPKPAAASKPAGQPVRVRTPKEFAGPCPRHPSHIHTKVYKTEGKVRRCRCDDCGHTWKQIGEPADPLGEFAKELAAQLEGLCKEPDEAAGGEPVIVITVQEALGIAEDLKKLLV